VAAFKQTAETLIEGLYIGDPRLKVNDPCQRPSVGTCPLRFA
jgi:hypothetical protein